MGDQVTPWPPVIVTLPAGIDAANAGQVLSQVCAAFTPGRTVVIADLTATIFCDSSCLRHLIQAHDRAAASDGLRLVIPPGSPVQRILELTGVHHRLAIYPTVAEAIAGPPPAPR